MTTGRQPLCIRRDGGIYIWRTGVLQSDPYVSLGDTAWQRWKAATLPALGGMAASTFGAQVQCGWGLLTCTKQCVKLCIPSCVVPIAFSSMWKWAAMSIQACRLDRHAHDLGIQTPFSGAYVVEEAAAARVDGAAAAPTAKKRKGGEASENGGASVPAAGGALELASEQLLAGHRQCVAAVAWPGDNLLVSGSWDHSVRF